MPAADGLAPGPRQAGILNINCFGLPAVKAVVSYKWGVWKRVLHCELACYLVWLLAFQAFVLIFQARCRLPASAPRLMPDALHTEAGCVKGNCGRRPGTLPRSACVQWPGQLLRWALSR